MLSSNYVITFGLTESQAIRRYIEALRVMGEDILYDEQTDGWSI